MAHIPDSGEPGNVFDELNLGPRKPELLSEATWEHINKRFQLRGELGAGGQAVVFEAKERNAPHRRVAIKVYHESTDAARRAFQNEARILASDRLPPEVVGYYECVTDEGIQNHIVLEFIDGRTLAWLGRAKREFSLPQKLELIERLARAFHQLHSCNLVFGDASANNILVEAEGSIRFVDLAGAKELEKGHGRTRSSINLVTPGFVPQTAGDSVAAKAVRTNLATDIYALAANAFLILTGRSEADVRSGESSRDATRLWEHALAQSHVPRGIRAIVLKGLRVPDERIDVDHRVYSTADCFADDLSAWKKRQKQKQSALVFGLPTLFAVAVLAVVAWTGWQKYEAERAARAVRVLEELSRQVEQLPNAAAPGVAELIAVGRAPLPPEAERTVSEVQTRIDALRRAQVVSNDLQWAEPLRESLGDVLNQSPWLTSAKAISQRRDKLARAFLQLKDDMEAGLTDDLQTRLAQLHQQLAELARENTLAVPAEQARIDYDRLSESISERLQAEDVFREIDRNADDSLRQLDAGDWNDARLQFGSCVQRLNDWLNKNETEDERAARHANNQDRVKELALEKEQLLADVDRVNKLVAAKDAELAKLNTSLSQLGTDSSMAGQAREKALAELKAAQEAIAAEAMQRKSAEQQVTRLRSEVERLTEHLAKLGHTSPDWLTAGLVAYYPLNGNANDESSNDNAGTTVSPKVVADQRGTARSALSFTNAEPVIVPSQDYLNLTSPSGFTISFWAKRDGKCEFSHILNKADGPGPAKKWTVILGEYNVPRGAPNKPYLGFHWPAGVSPQWTISDPIDWDTGWHCYAITKSGDTFAFYMDGVAIGSTKNSSPLLSTSGPLRIGKSQEGEPAFNGSVSDVRIYNRRLSPEEVKELYELESGDPQSVSSNTLTTQPQLDIASAEREESTVFLDDLPVESFRVKQGFQLGLRGKGGWEPDGQVIFNGSPVAHAVSMHARRGPGTFPSVAVFNLGGEYVRFKAQACFSGSPTEKALRGRTSFRVFASWNGEKLNHNPPHGGKELWASPTASDLSDVFDVDVDITEATQLMLVVDETSDDDSMSTVWMSPKLFRKSSL